MKIPLLAGSYEGISKDSSSEEAINWFYEAAAPRESKELVAPVHGATLFVTLANAGRIRQMLYNPKDELLYVISGDTLYEVTSLGGSTARGTIASSIGPVQMAFNPFSNQILIVEGNAGYIFNTSSDTFTTITDINFPSPAPGSCTYLDGYFIVEDPNNTGRFRWSNLNDGLTWGAFNFATVESTQSVLSQVLADRGRLFLLGAKNGEIWYNSGDPDNTFQRFEYLNAGTFSARLDGCLSMQLFDNSLMWVSKSNTGQLQVVRAGTSYQPEVVSTPQLSRKWQELSTSMAHITYTMQIDGHEFFVMTFTGSGNGVTYAYDATTKIWHQRSGAFVSGTPTREYSNCHAFCERWLVSNEFGLHVTGDYRANGKLYITKRNVYTWNSEAMERRLTGAGVALENQARLRFSSVELDMEISTGTAVLSWSKDHGHTFNTGRTLDLTKARMVSRKCGKSREWIFRVYTATTDKPIIMDLIGRIYGEPLQGFQTNV